MMLEAGLHEGVPLADYLGDPAPAPSLNSSIVRAMLRSPLHAWTAHPRLNPDYKRPVSAAFDLGSAAHAYLIEGRRPFVINAPDWRGKEARQQRDVARGTNEIALLEPQWRRVEEMAVVAQDYIEEYFGPLREVTLLWQEDGTWLRARPDTFTRHADGPSRITEYKTTTNADPEAFSRTVFALGYDIQAAMHVRGVRILTGRRPNYRWLVQESERPHALSICAPSQATLDQAEARIERVLEDWRWCLKEGLWRGYGKEPAWIEPPVWLQKAEFEREVRQMTRETQEQSEDGLSAWLEGDNSST